MGKERTVAASARFVLPIATSESIKQIHLKARTKFSLTCANSLDSGSKYDRQC